jgi:hypothetical protein
MPWLIVLALFFVPLIRSLTTGQKGTLCLLLFTGTYLLLKQKRRFAAGAVFGLLLFKPQLVLVIGAVMLFKKKWRFLAGVAVSALAFMLLTATLGSDVCWQYVRFCIGVTEYVHTSGYDLYKSHCLYGFLALLAGGKATLAVKCAAAIGAVLIFGMLWQTVRGTLHPQDEHFDLRFSALVLATLLLSPHLFTYDLTIMLLPMWLVTLAAVRGLLANDTGRKMVWLVAAMFVVSGFSHVLAALAGLQLTTLLMLALLWAMRRHVAAPGLAEFSGATLPIGRHSLSLSKT